MIHSPRFLKLVEDTKSRVSETTIEEVRSDLNTGNDFSLVDTREESEWIDSHAVGAIHLGKGVIERDIEKVVPDLSQKIVLYCGGGFRSALAADALGKMGYSNVYSLSGGWRAWKASGLPTTSG